MAAKYEFDSKIIRINDVNTKQDIIHSLKAMGIRKGMVLYVQSNAQKYAHIVGGVQTLIEAIQEVITYEGTLVCSSFTLDNIDPVCSAHYLYERDLYEEIRTAMPVFHKKKTLPSSVFARQLMCNEGVYRSYHPMYSFLAWGKYAKVICDKHPLHFSLGISSPLDKIQEMNGYVLMLGESIQNCDLLQYASTVCERTPIQIVSSFIETKGVKEEIKMLQCERNKEDFSYVQKMMEERNVMIENYIGNAHCRFFSAKEIVTLCKAYFYVSE